MARIEGLMRGGSLLVRLVFFFIRRSYGRVIKPARVYALASGLLLAIVHMEEIQEGPGRSERRSNNWRECW